MSRALQSHHFYAQQTPLRKPSPQIPVIPKKIKQIPASFRSFGCGHIMQIRCPMPLSLISIQMLQPMHHFAHSCFRSPSSPVIKTPQIVNPCYPNRLNNRYAAHHSCNSKSKTENERKLNVPATVRGIPQIYSVRIPIPSSVGGDGVGTGADVGASLLISTFFAVPAEIGRAHV